MAGSGRSWPRYVVVIPLATIAFCVATLSPWHPDPPVRRATAIVLAALILWITEVLPLGVTGLLIPIAATFTGVLKWPAALAAWGDPILFLFLGAFLLARALEKHGAFDFLVKARWAARFEGGHGTGLAIVVMLVAGAVSTMQSNTAVTAMLLPVVLALARRVRHPALVLLGLSYGATFGGMATPIGTPPNFIGYAAMQKIDPAVSFVSWMRIGVPIWLGTTAIGWGVLTLSRLWSRPAEHVTPSAQGPYNCGAAERMDPAARTAAPDQPGDSSLGRVPAARRWAVAAFALTVAVWLTSGAIVSLTPPGHAARVFVECYLPESLPPILAASLLFLVRLGARRAPVLDRDDFRGLDWDTLFLIAGGLCLGAVLKTSGAATALASAVSHVQLAPLVVMFGLGAVTVLLSELTSNTATAALMVPIAGSLAPAVGLSPTHTIWLVALSASLGFALPVSTPPNAIVYGTGLVPLRRMATLGIVVDVLALTWVVLCMHWLA